MQLAGWVSDKVKDLIAFLDKKKMLFIWHFWSAGQCLTSEDKNKMNK